METIAAIFAHGLGRTDVLVANRDDYVEAAAAKSAPTLLRKFGADIAVAATERDVESARNLAQVLGTRGLSAVVDVDLSKVDLAAYRHLAVLVGRGNTDWVEETCRRFLRASLADDTPRRLIPILIDRTARVPPLLSNFNSVDATGRSWSDVSDQIAGMLGSAPDDQPPVETKEPWETAGDAFIEETVQQLRRGDDIPLRRTLTRMVSASRALMEQNGSEPRIQLLLDRLVCLLATLIVIDRLQLLDRSLATLVGVYDAGFDERGNAREGRGGAKSSFLWFEVIMRVMALGGFAVRSEQWSVVRNLALQTPHGTDFESGYYSTWIRHGLTMAYRARVIGAANQPTSVIPVAATHVSEEPCLRPELPPEDDRTVTSICQFDALAAISVLVNQMESPQTEEKASVSAIDLYLPSFAIYYETRIEGIIARLIRDQSMRDALRIGNNQTLAMAITELNEAAGRAASESGHFWHGLEDRSVRNFLVQYTDPGRRF